MRRRMLEVTLSGYGSLVRGYGSRDLVESVTGRPPVWSARSRGWSCQEDTARDVVAVAERQGYDVVVTGARQAERARLSDSLTAPEPEQPDPGAGLW